MVDRAESLMDEIRQLKVQYVNEVGTGRRVWPRSIKERIFELVDLGLPAAVIAKKTSISSETISSWKFQRRHGVDKRFHALSVKTALPAIANPGTVTVPENKIPKNPSLIVMTWPDGLRIESTDAQKLSTIAVALRAKGAPCF